MGVRAAVYTRAGPSRLRPAGLRSKTAEHEASGRATRENVAFMGWSEEPTAQRSDRAFSSGALLADLAGEVLGEHVDALFRTHRLGRLGGVLDHLLPRADRVAVESGIRER